jgi:predicted DNA-binding protein (MmcQ/YjbR family)
MPDKKKDRAAAARADVLRYALTLPGAFEDHPWGESVAKAGGKIFVFLGVARPRELVVCVKLPESGADVLALPFAKPAGYGMGKHGWVHVTFGEKDVPPVAFIEDWVLESYRTVAPKKLVKELEARSAPPEKARPNPKRTKRKPASRPARARSR